jgi:hypothetical protein
MIEAHRNSTTTPVSGVARPDQQALCERVRGEYLEMPCLRLTLVQASRLFNLEFTHCSEVLQALVKEGVLRTDGREFLAGNVGRCH